MRVSFIAIAATFAFSSLWIGCGGEDEGLGSCPTNSATAEAAGHQVVVSSCQYCHASDVVGAARQGAPDDLNFDSLDTVRGEAAEMFEEAESGSMPPGNAAKVTGTNLENMRIWLACGAKQ